MQVPLYGSVLEGGPLYRGSPLYVFVPLLFPPIDLFSSPLQTVWSLQYNWRQGRYRLSRIKCPSEGKKAVYCLQYDDKKIVSGHRDNTIKVIRLL